MEFQEGGCPGDLKPRHDGDESCGSLGPWEMGDQNQGFMRVKPGTTGAIQELGSYSSSLSFSLIYIFLLILLVS